MMKALFFDGILSFRDDLPMPKRREGESLIRVEMAGICATDLEVLNGYAAFRGIPGHEFVGTVVESDEDGFPGRRVVGEINISCDDCDLCARKLHSHCESRRALGIRDCDGAFAEYLVLPDSNLHIVPDNVPNPCAVFTEPLAAACRILQQVEISEGDRVAVIGDGKLGLLAAQVLATRTQDVVAVGRHPFKLSILERRGIATCHERDFSARGFDIVVEATGSADGFSVARRSVRPSGTIVLKSTFAGISQIDMSSIVVDEIRLLGSRCGPFSVALKLLKKNAVDVDSLISGVYPLSKGVEAFAAATDSESLKILLRM